MRHLLLRTSPILLAVSTLWAGPCTMTTLDNYESLTPNVGCTVGPLIFENFSFVVQSQNNSPGIALASDVLVTPQSGAEFGLNFSSNKFTESGNQSVTYRLTYTEDPTGSIDSLDDALSDPVAAPGRGEIDTIGCLGGMFTALNTCSTGAANITSKVTVFDDGISPVNTASITFTGVSVLGIQETILLTGGGTGSVTPPFNFGSQSMVPEPGTFWLAVPIGALLLLARARFKRAQVRL